MHPVATIFAPLRTTGRLFPACCLLLLSGLPAFANNDQPTSVSDRMLSPYEAEYEARSRGLTSTAYRAMHRSHTDENTTTDTYRLTQGLSVRVLGANLITIEESSHFAQAGTSLLAGAYRYEQTGISRRHEHIRFDWQDRLAHVSTRDGELTHELPDGALDQLAFTAQMRLDVQTALEKDTGRTDFTYRIMDEHGTDEHLYRLDGNETLETPFGVLETIRLERIREPDSSRTTTVWLAPEAGYIMARLLQTEENGPDTELLLSSLTWTDEATGSD
ncbi:MAG: DUF3108 domain-containing protein [Pseudomonadota bacterium]